MRNSNQHPHCHGCNIYYKRSTYITFAVLNKRCEYLGCGVDDLFPYVADIDRPRKEECRRSNSPDGQV